jgi:hypothetical protein
MNPGVLARVFVIVWAAAAMSWSQETTNPHFDSDLSGWTIHSVPHPVWSAIDFAGNPDSGSVLVSKTVAGPSLMKLTQCVTVVPGATMYFRVRALVLASGNRADVTIDLTPHSDAACGTPTDLNRVIETPDQAKWVSVLHGPHVIPAGVQSIEVGLGVSETWNSTVPVGVHFDDAEFMVFEGNFETAACNLWSRTVPPCITPEAGLHVELTWNTPGDPVPGDEVGTDMDLHLRHPSGGAFWGGTFDCYSANPTPDWGVSGTSDDPWLFFEDDDGAGPEAIQITQPEPVEYDIGVHYVDDLSFGGSTATVRVFLDGTMISEYLDKSLVEDDIWFMGTVLLPEGTFTLVNTVTSGPP